MCECAASDRIGKTLSRIKSESRKFLTTRMHSPKYLRSSSFFFATHRSRRPFMKILAVSHSGTWIEQFRRMLTSPCVNLGFSTCALKITADHPRFCMSYAHSQFLVSLPLCRSIGVQASRERTKRETRVFHPTRTGGTSDRCCKSEWKENGRSRDFSSTT